MIKFKGFDDWIPIFQGGKQIDSAGKEHDGNALIDKAVASFNAAAHEPPACIGHPKDDAPAYGWVESLKKQGNLLLAKFKQIQPEFEEMLKKGLFKKRSAAFYPDGTLRHVAFLGATPPAVKGLPDVAFADGEVASFEFVDYQTVWAWESIARMFGRMRDYLIEKDGVEKADQIISSYNIEEITAAAAQEKQEVQAVEQGDVSPGSSLITLCNEKEDKNMTFKEKLAAIFGEVVAKIPDEKTVIAAAGQFSEADLLTAKTEAATKEREKVTAEFAEKAKTARQATRKSEISAFCESMVKAGKLTPAMVKFGVPEFLLAFADREDVIEFGETKEKATLYDRFKALIETEMPKVVIFGEVATRAKDAVGTGTAGDKVEALIAAKIKDKKELSYSAAFAEVQTENPDLATEYAQEIKGDK